MLHKTRKRITVILAIVLIGLWIYIFIGTRNNSKEEQPNEKVKKDLVQKEEISIINKNYPNPFFKTQLKSLPPIPRIMTIDTATSDYEIIGRIEIGNTKYKLVREKDSIMHSRIKR